MRPARQVLLFIREHLVREARNLAQSRLAMHRLGDKEPVEYREQIDASIAEMGDFLEDEEVLRAAGVEIEKTAVAIAQEYDDAWYRDYLSRMWEGAKTPDG